MTREEWCDVKTWKLALLIGGLTAVAVFGAAAVAFGGAFERGVPLMGRDGGMMVAADGDGARAEGRGCGGFGLLQDPQAREDMQALREEHRAEMNAWWDEYGDDPQSEAAQKALATLREDHRADMLALFDKYGVTPPEGFGEGGGCGAGTASGGGCGGRGADAGGFGGSGCGGGSGAMSSGQGWGGGTL